jgi:hypothetical protein
MDGEAVKPPPWVYSQNWTRVVVSGKLGVYD